jgi:hypothetical protein
MVVALIFGLEEVGDVLSGYFLFILIKGDTSCGSGYDCLLIVRNCLADLTPLEGVLWALSFYSSYIRPGFLNGMYNLVVDFVI